VQYPETTMPGEDATSAQITESINRAMRQGQRIRMVLRANAGDPRSERVVEGVPLEVAAGRDGRARVRVGIATGTGDPVEVRVLLTGIERVDDVAEEPSEVTRPPTGERPVTARRQTLQFGQVANSQSAIRPVSTSEPERPAADANKPR
jgi:hypothetical protein